MIGIPIKQNKTSEIVALNKTTKNIERILQTYIEEDIPVDIFINSKKNIKETGPIGKAKGHAFQLKRIRENSEKDKTESILKFLKEYIPKKYPTTEATLVLVIGESGKDGKFHELTINVTKIKKEFNPKEYPFQSVLFTSKTYDDKLLIGELWPSFGVMKLHFKNFRFLR